MSKFKLTGILAAVLVIMGLSGWAGYRFHPTCPASTVNTVVRKDTVTIKKPDGTVEERTSESTANSSTPVKPSLPKWSAQADVRAPLNKLSDYNYTGYLYRRVSDTNLWAGFGISSKKEVAIGIRIDF